MNPGDRAPVTALCTHIEPWAAALRGPWSWTRPAARGTPAARAASPCDSRPRWPDYALGLPWWSGLYSRPHQRQTHRHL